MWAIDDIIQKARLNGVLTQEAFFCCTVEEEALNYVGDADKKCQRGWRKFVSLSKLCENSESYAARDGMFIAKQKKDAYACIT
jgi:hypothetical protein